MAKTNVSGADRFLHFGPTLKDRFPTQPVAKTRDNHLKLMAKTNV